MGVHKERSRVVRGGNSTRDCGAVAVAIVHFVDGSRAGLLERKEKMTNTHAITAARRMAVEGLIQNHPNTLDYAASIINTATKKRYEELVVQVVLLERFLRHQGFTERADVLSDELRKLGV